VEGGIFIKSGNRDGSTRRAYIFGSLSRSRFATHVKNSTHTRSVHTQAPRRGAVSAVRRACPLP